MTSFNPTWDASWTSTSISSSSISNSSSATTASISNDNKFATEIGIQCTYGAATASAEVYVFRDLDGTNYETFNDFPWGFQLPYATSTTRYRTFTVSGQHISAFKVNIRNVSGASITATVKYRQCTVDQT